MIAKRVMIAKRKTYKYTAGSRNTGITPHMHAIKAQLGVAYPSPKCGFCVDAKTSAIAVKTTQHQI